MPSIAHIRRAVARDAKALAVLAEKTFRDTYTAFNTVENMQSHCASSFGESIQLAEINAPDRENWVAEADGKLVAFAELILEAPCPSIPNRRGIEILRFYVDSPYHGTGLARELMERLATRVAAIGADVLWLGVWKQNHRAIAFYKKCRFAPVGETTFKLGNDVQQDLVMSRSIQGG